MEQILLDTDVLIDFLRGHQKRIRDLFLKIENKDLAPCTTVLNIAELYSGKDARDPEKLAALEQLLSYFDIIPIERETAKLAGRLRLEHNLGLADSVVAACAITNKFKLFTLNLKHFQNIKGLNLFSI